jgi:hypothetical protein
LNQFWRGIGWRGRSFRQRFGEHPLKFADPGEQLIVVASLLSQYVEGSPAPSPNG